MDALGFINKIADHIMVFVENHWYWFIGVAGVLVFLLVKGLA